MARSGGVLCSCPTSTQAAKRLNVSMSAQTWWDVLDDAEELLGRWQLLDVPFLGAPWGPDRVGAEKCSRAPCYRNSH